jgi:TonB-dependent receptor
MSDLCDSQQVKEGKDRMKNNKMFTRTAVAKAVTLLLGGTAMLPVYAQQAPAQPNADSTDVEVIQVRGIRGSMQQAAAIKRESMGVVDAISAEDIGKFPDTNLAESLQRITGVSISRTNGEGAEVTVRGFGGDNNMVTLNGRTMPSATTYAAGSGADGTTRGGGARAFDFSNLASESISGVEVYKTSKANIATGGIGATVNVLTAKPLERSDNVASIGVKAAHDTTNRTGDDVTPEISGIFSHATDDGKFGVAVSASHQVRHSGYTGATVNDWQVDYWDDIADLNRTWNSTPLKCAMRRRKGSYMPGPMTSVTLFPIPSGNGTTARSRCNTNPAKNSPPPPITLLLKTCCRNTAAKSATGCKPAATPRLSNSTITW